MPENTLVLREFFQMQKKILINTIKLDEIETEKSLFIYCVKEDKQRHFLEIVLWSLQEIKLDRKKCSWETGYLLWSEESPL